MVFRYHFSVSVCASCSDSIRLAIEQRTVWKELEADNVQDTKQIPS
jgi:hypothetical protein